MEDLSKKHQETRCIHGSFIPDEKGAVVTPIYQTSTFSFRNVDHGANLFAGEEEGYIYTRIANPTIQGVEKAVSLLEKGANAIGCASGMAAVHLILASELKKGDHVICSGAVYGPVNTILREIVTRWGVSVDFVDTSDIEAIKEALKPETRLIHIETPGNPTNVVSDIRAISDLAHQNGARVSVDNTFLSPILQQPLELGADVVMHSMTKFLNGHADVVAGIVVLKDREDYTRYRSNMNLIGGVINPFDAFLVSRGIKTLAIRMKRHCRNSEKIAKYLDIHQKVEQVHFPWLPSHPQHEVARKQMKGAGGIVSFELKGGLEAGRKLMNSVELHTLAVSLGGVESLIQHPASMTHATMDAEERRKAGIKDGLVRISVGIENVDELIEDLENGLAEV